MRVLAIDLGETTGFCVLEGNREPNVSDLSDRMKSWYLDHGTTQMFGVVPLLDDYEIDLVVIERPASIRAGARIQEQYSDAISSFRQTYGAEKVKVVKPADWMPRFHSYPLPGRGVLKTQHEKDAYRMAHWALDKFV